MSPKASAHASQTAANKVECVSMTGYAQARGEQNGWTIRVSVKSVNHRFLDVRFRLPEGFDVYELRLRQIVRERIHRGHIDVNVNVQPGTAVPVQVNRDLLQAYAQSDEEQDQLGKALYACLREALLKLDDMRHAEGRHLAEELRTRVARIGQQADQVRDLAKALTPAFARRLQTRLKELLNGTGIEPARLAQEAALLAERSDISEELDRLRSHLQQFAKLLD